MCTRSSASAPGVSCGARSDPDGLGSPGAVARVLTGAAGGVRHAGSSTNTRPSNTGDQHDAVRQCEGETMTGIRHARPADTRCLTPLGAVTRGLGAAAVGTLAMDLLLYGRFR